MSKYVEFEVFIITNGRKTFDTALRCLSKQSLPLKVTQFENMVWHEALNLINKQAESPFYFRVDDDFFLHPRAVEYMAKQMARCDHNKTAAYICHLYEPAEFMPVRGIKLYNTKIAREVGFRPNELGKIDKNFRKDITRKGCKFAIDKSVVGIHANSDLEDEKKYRDLWKSIAPKHNRKLVVGNEPISEQHKMLKTMLPKLNKKTGFRKYL